MIELKQAKIVRITNPPRPGEDRVIIHYDPIEVGDLFVFESPSGKYTMDTCKRVEGDKVYGYKSTILGYPPTYKVGATHRQIAKKEIKIDGKRCRVDMDDEEIDEIIHRGDECMVQLERHYDEGGNGVYDEYYKILLVYNKIVLKL